MTSAWCPQRIGCKGWQQSDSSEIVKSKLQENHKLILLLTQMSSVEKILSGLAILITIL